MSAAAPTVTALRHAREQHATIWRWLRLAGPLIVVVQLAGLVRSSPPPGLHGVRLVLSAAIAGFAIGAFGTFLTRGGPAAARIPFVVLLFTAGVVLVRLQPAGPGVLGLFVAVALVARRLPGREGLVLVGAGVVVLTTAITPGRGAVAGLVTGIAMASFYAVTRLAQRLSETNRQAEQLLLELERGREAEARAAALAERQRLAREMHDVLAHSLSGLLLQLEGARMIAGSADDRRLPELIDRAHHLARSGLDEARHAIGMLRDDALPGPDELPGLAEQFEHDTGVPCRFAVTGEPRPLGTDARLTVYRVAQESLTNVRKHASPDSVSVVLAYGPDTVRLVVEDRAGTVRDSEPSGGYGLTGMRERAELLGAGLTTTATPTGFRVELECPA